MIESPNNIKTRDFILSESGRCVACNLCLPYCPTYQLTQKETESPRGRISLLSAMADEKLSASGKLISLLDHCLLCGACESHCPSSVSFSRLMDKGRQLIKKKRSPEPLRTRIAENLLDLMLHKPEWIRRAVRLSWPLHHLPFTRHENVIGKIKSYLKLFHSHRRWKTLYSTPSTKKHITLFTGCVTRGLDGRTIDDAIFVLNHIGFTVIIPPSQSCCSALSLHAGREKQAISMMQQNVKAFPNPETPVIYLASGCGNSLLSYHHFINDQGFSRRADEISHFINKHWPETNVPSLDNLNVILHTPCSMENSQMDADAPRQLLGRFDKISLKNTESTYHCCGAAGSKMLTDIKVSSSLRQPLLQFISAANPDYFLTSNIGCALHISEGLNAMGKNIPVKHPVSLVADILRQSK